MTAARLSADLAPYRGVPGLLDTLTRLLDGVPVDDPVALVYGHYLTATDTYLALHLATRTGYALLEATRDGTTFSVTVPVTRIRRVALMERTTPERTATLTIEMDADRAALSGSMTADGVITAQTQPAGYEITAVTEPDIAALKYLQAGLIRTLSL